MTALKTFFTNGAESTLSSALSAGVTTINVTSTTAFPAVPFYVVIDPDVDASREVVLVDGSKTATTFVLSAASKRGQDGTTDVAHSTGAKVAFVPVAAHFTDMHDRMDTAYVAAGTDVAVADGGTGASTAAAARTNLGLAIGTDVQAYSAVLAGTTASFTSADKTKLDGIEALADVTDAANVAAAGAVMEADTSTAPMQFVIDEDTMVSNSATKVPTQQSVKAYVDGAIGGVSAVDRAVIAGFLAEAGGTGGGIMRYFGISGGGSTLAARTVVMPRAGSIVGLSVALSGARTAGSITFEVYKNGVATGLTVTIDGTNTQYHYATQASGADTFVAGDRITAQYVTEAFTPTTPAEALIEVEFD